MTEPRRTLWITEQQLEDGYVTLHPGEVPNTRRHKYTVLRREKNRVLVVDPRPEGLA